MGLTEVNQLLKPADLAEYLGVSKSTLLAWRERYRMPYVKTGETILIPEPQFLEWIEHVGLKNGGYPLRIPRDYPTVAP